MSQAGGGEIEMWEFERVSLREFWEKMRALESELRVTLRERHGENKRILKNKQTYIILILARNIFFLF